MERKLYLSNTNKKISGVCGGLSEYFGIDAVIVRLVMVGSVFLHGFGLIAYIAAWAIMPKKQNQDSSIYHHS
jgi:phage shock protein C